MTGYATVQNNIHGEIPLHGMSAETLYSKTMLGKGGAERKQKTSREKKEVYFAEMNLTRG